MNGVHIHGHNLVTHRPSATPYQPHQPPRPYNPSSKWRQPPPPPSNVPMLSRRYSPPPQPIPPSMEYRGTRPGAPVKKSKFGASGSLGNLTANGSQGQGQRKRCTAIAAFDFENPRNYDHGRETRFSCVDALAAQAYLYYITYPRDSLPLKALVGGIWGLATLHAGLLTVAHTVYHYSVRTTHSPVDVEAAISTAYVIVMSGRWRVVPTAALMLLLVAQIGFGISTVCSICGNLATLCIILYDARGFTMSVRLIKTLIIYSMNRFLLTTLVVVAQTAILISKPESIWAMVIKFISAQRKSHPESHVLQQPLRDAQLAQPSAHPGLWMESQR
ncbi:hypothetical protein BDN71DRAFT_1594803 [Pleurotus eryngii]|uniref:Uncharacterized protein n=1 Tax=Pleurotus eryngii TaxID=5323 RepID=A0A9P5ZGJ0_PLEER|nr:hypothetical protein BDN71DRAFT_1594803 [Pleurotus eryngii]